MGCSSTQKIVHLQSCYSNNPPWPIHNIHFYDGEIHLVPSFAKSPQGYNKPNYMIGYAVVFVKAGSVYEKLGLQNGDVIKSIDATELQQTSSRELLQKIKTRQFQTIKMDRCLEVKTLR